MRSPSRDGTYGGSASRNLPGGRRHMTRFGRCDRAATLSSAPRLLMLRRRFPAIFAGRGGLIRTSGCGGRTVRWLRVAGVIATMKPLGLRTRNAATIAAAARRVVEYVQGVAAAAGEQRPA